MAFGPGAAMSESDRRQVTQAQVAKDFDDVAGDYENKINAALAFGGREHAFYINVKREHILRLARNHFPDIRGIEVLDLGCGLGAYHAGLEGKFGELHGIDVSAHSVEVAASRHPFVRYTTFDGERLPYANSQFSLAFTVCVMHHVPPSQWAAFVDEMHRVIKPGGLALVFEHNPYNPATQYIVKTCDIDKDAVLLRPVKLRRLFGSAGFRDVHTRTIISVPPASAFLAGIDSLLGRLPFGAQYYLSAVKPVLGTVAD
jgi:ubiquinone/menaquinone biosynthesis C-methylase UbiE